MMDQSTQIILFISILTVMGMLAISAIMYYVERDKRQLQAIEYWFSYVLYFTYSYFSTGATEKILAIGTIYWFWRVLIIQRILQSACNVSLKSSWHIPLIASSYLFSFFYALKGENFILYTFPQAFCVFIVSMDYLLKSLRSLKQRGRTSVTHYILFFTIFIIFAHLLDYPFYRNIPMTASLGFGISLMCNILMGIVLPAVTIHELKLERQLELEKLVEERSAMLLSQAKFSALGEMTAGIAHEINNPLGIIANRTSHLRNHVLRDRASKEFIVRNLEQIEATSERMSKIIRSLRNFSKDNRNEPFQKNPVGKLVEETLSYCSDRFHLNAIKLILDPCPEREIECRSVQVSQVLLNLLNNSFDAVVERKEAWVRISYEVGDQMLKIVITDSGPGISEEVRKRIMEPFFTTKELTGTGLGLSISRGIIDDHRGRLYYDESSSHTRFVVELPYLQSET